MTFLDDWSTFITAIRNGDSYSIKADAAKRRRESFKEIDKLVQAALSDRAADINLAGSELENLRRTVDDLKKENKELSAVIQKLEFKLHSYEVALKNYHDLKKAVNSITEMFSQKLADMQKAEAKDVRP